MHLTILSIPMAVWGGWYVSVHWINFPRSGTKWPYGNFGTPSWDLCRAFFQLNWKLGLQCQSAFPSIGLSSFMLLKVLKKIICIWGVYICGTSHYFFLHADPRTRFLHKFNLTYYPSLNTNSVGVILCWFFSLCCLLLTSLQT